MSNSTYWNPYIFAAVMIVLMLLLPSISVAEVLEPNPTLTVKQAYDSILDGGAFNKTRALILGFVTGSFLIFSAWATYGLFEAHFVEKQISLKAAVFLFVRLLAMLTILITLISL